MLGLVELFEICNNRRNYTTITPKNKKYEVDYKFIEDAETRTLYIFFEPSDGRTDWIVNFSYWRKPYKEMEVGYRVHGGFLESWKLIDDMIGAKVREVDIPEINEDGHYNWKWQKIVVVGYSHGGALAALCHEYVWFNRQDLREEGLVGISFDGPRVYAGLHVKKALSERWRNFYIFRNHGDIVTHLPPVIFGFRHVGNKIRIGAGRNPGLIGAHYPDKIMASLKSYEAEGAPDLKEKVISVVEGFTDTFKKIEGVIDRIPDADEVREKINEIVEDIKRD